MRVTPAQGVLIAAALTLLVEPLADGWMGVGVLVEQHIGSDAWPGHAKYHVIRQGFACIFLGLGCAWGHFALWSMGMGTRWLLAALPLLTNAAGVLSLVLSPVVFGVPDPLEVAGLGGPAIGAGVLLTVLGLFLERREARAVAG